MHDQNCQFQPGDVVRATKPRDPWDDHDPGVPFGHIGIVTRIFYPFDRPFLGVEWENGSKSNGPNFDEVQKVR